MQRIKRGELNKAEEKEQLIKNVRRLKEAQEQDSKKIENLREMIEQLLLSEKGKDEE